MEKDEIFEEHLDAALEFAAADLECSTEELLAKIEFIDGDLNTECSSFGAIYPYVDLWTVEHVANALTEKCNNV